MARIEEVHETHVVPGPKNTKPKNTPTVVKYYLAAYNALSALGWSYVLVATVVHLFSLDSKSAPPLVASLAKSLPFLPRAAPVLASSKMKLGQVEAYLPPSLIPILRRATTTYARVGYQTALVQSMAAMEVMHSLLGFVRSPVSTTVMQVWSRYFLVWGVADVFKGAKTSPFYASMVLSWAVTEVIRYSHYALNLLGTESHLLLWLRYTTFYILYPTGAGSEAFVMLASLPKGTYSLYDYTRALFFFIWWPGLAFMMMHMQKQRKKALRGNKARTGPRTKSS